MGESDSCLGLMATITGFKRKESAFEVAEVSRKPLVEILERVSADSESGTVGRN